MTHFRQPSVVTVGVDVSSVQRIASLVERRPGFLTKMFTPEEVAYCANRPERLAARWAAKEAVRKVYGSNGWQLPTYSSISVSHRGGGAPQVLVQGRPVPGLEISLTHDAGISVAVAAMAPGQQAPGGGLRGWPSDVKLPARPGDGHKGTFGTVLVLAGSPSFPGAAVLVCHGALRGGAGKVKVAVGAADLGLPPEAIRVPLSGSGAVYSEEAAQQLGALLGEVDAVVCGPGLGADDPIRGFLRVVLREMAERGERLVLDADALNAISRFDDLRALVPPGCIMTPHPLEASRLAGSSVEVIQADRSEAAVRLAAAYRAVVVLKGAHTVVAGPSGTEWVDGHATPALAIGGSGDVLAGLLAALLAQGMAAFEGACAGVFLHGEAGTRLASSRGRAGNLATEVASELVETQEAVRQLMEAEAQS